MHFIFKICQTVVAVSMSSQFHEFFNLIFCEFLPFGPAVRCYGRNLNGLGFSYMSFVAAVITLVLNINNNINANNNNLNRINLNYGSSKNTLTSLNQNVGNNFNIMLPPGKKKKRKRRRRKKRSINIENLEDLLLELALLGTKYV